MLVMLFASDFVGYDIRRVGLFNAPLDRSPQYDNHGT